MLSRLETFYGNFRADCAALWCPAAGAMQDRPVGAAGADNSMPVVRPGGGTLLFDEVTGKFGMDIPVGADPVEMISRVPLPSDNVTFLCIFRPSAEFFSQTRTIFGNEDSSGPNVAYTAARAVGGNNDRWITAIEVTSTFLSGLLPAEQARITMPETDGHIHAIAASRGPASSSLKYNYNQPITNGSVSQTINFRETFFGGGGAAGGVGVTVFMAAIFTRDLIADQTFITEWDQSILPDFGVASYGKGLL